MGCDPTINYTEALDRFVQYGINKIRIWIYCWFGTTSFNALTPWERDAFGRHDLDRWNPTYWKRVREFVTRARDRNIIVEITIFSPYPAAGWWWSHNASRVAWNRAHNVNNAFSSNPRGHFQPQFFDLNYSEKSSTGKTLRDYQQALVDKVVAELGSLGNVYFEICNEFGTYGLEVDRWHSWQLHWAQLIDLKIPRLVAVHAGFGPRQTKAHLYQEKGNIDVLNFRFAVSPQVISDTLHPAQTSGKVFTVNESTSGDFHASRANLNAAMRVGWGMFVSGGYFALYEDDSSRIGDARWIEGAKRLKALRDIAERVRFWELSPIDRSGNEYDALISRGPSGSNWQLLASPGSEYLAYFWGSTSTTSVRIRLPASTYSYSWYDVRDARVLTKGTVSSNGIATVPAPPTTWDASSGVTLVIRKI